MTGAEMKVITARQLANNTRRFLSSKEPVLVTQRERIIGVYFPEENMPAVLKRAIFSLASGRLSQELRKRRLTEEDLLRDFKSWRRARRSSNPPAH